MKLLAIIAIIVLVESRRRGIDTGVAGCTLLAILMICVITP